MNDGPWNALVAEWLAGLFMAPLPIDTVETCRNGLGATLLDALGEEPGAAPGIRLMRLALMTEGSALAVQRGLASAFTHLFIGVAGPQTVSLYESTHVSASARLFQRPVGDMNQVLRHLDVAPSDTFREPADHLSMELALLGHLIRTDARRAVQLAFLDEHLLVWVPGFARQCGEADRTGFYAGASSALTDFLSRQRMALVREVGSAALLSRGTGHRPRRATNRATGVMLCRSE